MSQAEPGNAGAGNAGSARPGRGRFVRSELALTFGRRRNLMLLGVLAVVPVVIGVAVKAGRNPGRGGSILGGVTDNGLFAALAALLVAGPLFLPLVIAVVAGDAVAGEASLGTLRYLLALPVGRTRLLVVKLTAILAWSVSCVALVAVVGVVTGVVLFPAGRLTLLSGRQVSFGDGVLRLALVAGYVAVTVLVVGAIGLFVSTLTEVPVAAMAATLVSTVVSEVLDEVPQLSVLHPWLPTHHWLAWVDILREPVRTGDMVTGLFASAAYVAFFVSLAWARFDRHDITS